MKIVLAGICELLVVLNFLSLIIFAAAADSASFIPLVVIILNGAFMLLFKAIRGALLGRA